MSHNQQLLGDAMIVAYGAFASGHAEAVLSVSFSPDSRQLASGSGDTTVRFWDISTQTPLHTGTGRFVIYIYIYIFVIYTYIYIVLCGLCMFCLMLWEMFIS